MDTARDDDIREHLDRDVLGLLWVHPEERFSPLGDGVFSLGRDPCSDIYLLSSRASGHQASIQREGADYVLRDERSRNGTWHNGFAVHEARLVEGDVVRVGDDVAVVVELPPDVVRSAQLFVEPAPGIVIGPRSRSGWASAVEIACSDLPVVLEGPTGSGKEVYARALHASSGRSGPFVAQNCAALPEALVEAMLFGYTRGAFTGAAASSPGIFAAADAGTLFLDEVLELPLTQQAKLLRAVEERAVAPIGQCTVRPVDVRIITSAQRPLGASVADGSVRADLFARLSGATLKLTPLTERAEEAVPLFKRFFQAFGGETTRLRGSFVEAVCLADWPLNVRQLHRLAQAAAVRLAKEPSLTKNEFEQLAATLGTEIPNAASESSADAVCSPASCRPRRSEWLGRHQSEIAALRDALSLHFGNVSKAAKAVGISRQKAQRLLVAERERPLRN